MVHVITNLDVVTASLASAVLVAENKTNAQINAVITGIAQ
jgi:hypothetical protein